MAKVRVGLGLLLLWGALGVLGYRLGWQTRARHGQAALLHSAQAALHSEGGCASSATPGDGQLAGVLRIPQLGVTAPVEGGTADAVLNVAVGHADGTPWPGSTGTAVMLAHDVSYFANLNQLQPGAVVQYQAGAGCVTETFKVVGHQVVKAGSAVPDVPGAALVLDTCWPTDALWYTPDRYLVEAVETGISATAPGSPAPAVAPPVTYTTPAPADLAATGLGLEQNEEPMGTLTLAGTPSSVWAQSPGPLAVEAAALQAWFGGWHALGADRSDWWSAVAPQVPMPAAVGGTDRGSGATPLEVTITAQGDQPQAVTLSTVMPVAGGQRSGTYHVTVTEAVHGTQVVITNWEMN